MTPALPPSIRDRRPWLPYAAAAFLAPRIAGRRVFEWGVGGSTLWFADRGAVSVDSVDHDPGWVATVRRAVARDARVRLLLRPASPGTPGSANPADPDGYASAVVRGATFRDYAQAIAAYPPRHFDLVLIDGRSRCACFKAAVPHVAAGGLVILDDASRDRYRWCLEEAARLGWARQDFAGAGPYADEPWTTAVWRIP